MSESCPDCVKWKMAAEMIAADDAFYSTYDDKTKTHSADNTKLCIIMNDVWAWATADGETVEWNDIPEVYGIWKNQGNDGLLVWACKRRNAKPQKCLFDKLKPEVQAQVKDLPGFGTAVYNVGDGKCVTFDDGWN